MALNSLFCADVPLSNYSLTLQLPIEILILQQLLYVSSFCLNKIRMLPNHFWSRSQNFTDPLKYLLQLHIRHKYLYWWQNNKITRIFNNKSTFGNTKQFHVVNKAERLNKYSANA